MVFNPLHAYIKALKSPNLDSSDYILLVTHILRETLDSSDKKKFSEIEHDYLNLNYRDAMAKINALCEEGAANKIDPSMLKLIKSRQKDLVDNQMENQSRRFFETRLSQIIWHAQEAAEIASMAKMNIMMREWLNEIIASTATNPNQAKMQQDAKAALANLPINVNSIKEAQRSMAGMRDFGLINQEVLEIDAQIRSSKDSIYNTKDRGAKKPTDQDPEQGAWSANHGMVKSTAPMMPADRLKIPKKDKITDTFYMDEKHPGYSAARTIEPYVNSISGTTYRLAAILKIYMEKHVNDSILAIDVNNIVKAFIGFTCKKGYHSLIEIVDALNDPAVIKLFEDKHIKLNTDFLTDTALTAVFDESSNYSKNINLQRGVNEEITTRRPKSVTPAIETIIQNNKDKSTTTEEVDPSNQELKNEELDEKNNPANRSNNI